MFGRFLSFVALFALTAFVAGCLARPPRARLVVASFDGTRPQYLLIRCLSEGLGAERRHDWTLSPSVRALGAGVASRSGSAIAVELRGAVGRGEPQVSCEVKDRSGRIARATLSLAPLGLRQVSPVEVAPGAPLEVSGAGLGVGRYDADAVYLVPSRGVPVALIGDPACPGAQWGKDRIVACVPRETPTGSYQLRVQSRGRLAVAPGPRIRVGPARSDTGEGG